MTQLKYISELLSPMARQGFSSLMALFLLLALFWSASKIYADLNTRISESERRYSELLVPTLNAIEQALRNNTDALNKSNFILDRVIGNL